MANFFPICVNFSDEQKDAIEVPSTTAGISNLIDAIDNILINDKVQMIDVSDVAVTTDGQDQEDEEVECESKPDTSSTFFR